MDKENRPYPMPSPTENLPLTELAAERLHNFLYRKRADRLRATALKTPFSDTHERMLLVSQSARIPQSQIFPYHYFAAALADTYDVSIRETSLDDMLAGHSIPHNDATIVAFQTPYDITDDDLERLLDKLRSNSPGARLIYLDWSAPADLRNAERLNPHIDIYIKKHVLRDRGQYGQKTLGDTNLADRYARRLNIAEEEYCFDIPAGFLDKLLVGPSFATAPLLLPELAQPFAFGQERSIDLHARFTVTGTDWYQAMRSEAEAALDQFADLQLARGSNLPLYRFICELRRAKVCFSPFGYGEVCWRDYEAVMTGAVLLKPDMDHIETAPDIFRPWETYVPLSWDLSDFDEALQKLLGDAPLRESIARNAHAVLFDYLNSDGFIKQMRPLFSMDMQ